MKRLVFSAALAFSLTSFAREYFVDCNRPDDSGDGQTEETAKKTIQAAVDLAGANDIVTVLPGHYRDSVLSGADDIAACVCLTNGIILRAKGGRAGRDVTFIHGAHATTLAALDTKGRGMGADAVRCIFVSPAGKASRIEGFTLLDGATDCVNSPSWYQDRNRGGGLYADSGVTVVDCVISNCVATYGGAIYGGEVARSWVTDCYSLNGGSAGYATKFYHSILSRSTGGVTLNVSKVYNCTLVENYTSYSAASWSVFQIYNSVLLHNAGNSAVPWADVKNSVVDKAMPFYSGDVSTSDLADLSTCQVLDMTSEADIYQFLAPALDDYRPLAGARLVGTGSAEALGSIPAEFRTTDYRGVAFDPEIGVNAGAFQCAVEPATGALVLKGALEQPTTANYKSNGKIRMVSGLYAFGERFPEQICLGYALPTNPGYAFWGFAADGADTATRFPQLDDTTWVLPPPVGKTLTLTATATSRVYWTDPNTAETVKDGKEATPYATLQDAVDQIPLNSQAVIFAKKGDYADGGATALDSMNRVYLGAKWIRLVAVDGPAETAIVGEADDLDEEYGLGDATVRCVGLGGSGQSALNQTVCGFTLRGGRTSATGLGGAARGWGAGAKLTDCVIADCCANEGAAAYGVSLVRCRVTGCTAKTRGMIRSGWASSTVFEDCRKGNDTAYVYGESAQSWHCTVLEPSRSVPMNLFYGGGGKHVNDVYMSVYGIGSWATTFAGCVVWDWVWMGAEHAGMLQADPMIVGKAGGDLNVGAFSPAVGLGDVADPDYYLYAATDITGRPLRLADNGKPTSGAYQEPVPTVRVVTSSSGQLSGDGIAPLGTNYVCVGDSLTLTATDVARRNLAGFRVDGELVSGGTSYVYTPSAALVGTQEVAIAAEYVPHWYVDPAGDDANNGWSWDTPKQTLAAIMAMAVSNDTVHAAPGAYTNGTMLQSRALYSGTPELRARVAVKSFVTLESRDGAEKTFIVGAPAPAENANEYGCGTGAVRCVAMEANARLKGFTITGGRCYYDISSNDDNNRGAGVISDRFTGLVSDCIISNNAAHSGGGALFGRYARCRFLENVAPRGYAACNMVAWGCYFDRNRSQYPVAYWQKLVGCTIGPDNVTMDGGPAPLGNSPYASNGWSSPEVDGTLICSASIQTGASLALTNCAFASELLAKWSPNAVTNDTCVIVPAAELLTVGGVPVVGANAAIDRGEATWWPKEFCGTTDAAGNQRVFNGAMDIGCFEADWRASYSRALGRQVRVRSADPQVVQADARHVLVGDGELALEFGCRPGTESSRTFTAQVTGNGVLTVTRNGETFATLSAAEGERVFAVPEYQAPDAFVFSYAPGTDDDGGALLSAFKGNLGSAIILR